ncbi:MAG: hypothetical protein O6849_01885 [Candidatus Dadabacteria bacterium]|jgi:hypothetical protein|nr:hypothetical protein [Candidatus Dadabacteria bacterium]MCZ6469411.1 hypothetical protein [Candidatus Dadabacteria bacterium]MCZ6527274.1 hypothetical protein [Candidatus Dadabacteria bacterium]MCZ6555021.1 hypothetical protein [Candidatus Dadabacteria bacterium]MCZ6684716.1 hypothetical protein [Candidatus Dadabacteria bacterium]
MKFKIAVSLTVIFILLVSVFTGNTKETEVKICALNGEKIQKEVLEVLPDNNPQVSGQL